MDDAIPYLRELYSKGGVERKMLLALAALPEEEYVVTVDSLVMAGDNGRTVPRPAVIKFLKSLHERGLGVFWTGRKGAFSRIALACPAKAVGLAAAGQRDTFQSHESETKPDEAVHSAASSSPEATHEKPDVELLAHRFVLRPGLQVDFALPRDLTKSESQRLARFMESLPFEG